MAGVFCCAFSCLLLFGALEVVSSSSSVSDDAISLLAFKKSVSFDPYNLLSDWNLDKTHCHWYGVTCDSLSLRVTSLNITGTTSPSSPDFTLLTGTLSPQIGNLTELRILALPHNAFYGEIPVEIEKLQYLEILQLQGNNFSGSIPGQLTSLRFLNLSYNSFSGSIPNELLGFSKRISSIDISYNQLSHEIRIDPFTTCQSLVHLKLSGNFLVNKIPPDIGNCSNLRSLLLDSNILEGQIPKEIGKLSQLRILDVSRNSLTGIIPKELANCTKLSVIVLTNLKVESEETSREEFNAFAGRIPPNVLRIPNLKVFWAPRANLRGNLLSYWRRSCKLRVLNLGQNYITGRIPERLALCKQLSFLDLSSNALKGYLPLQLQVSCMVNFNISGNSLSGSLPRFANSSCSHNIISASMDGNFFEKGNIDNVYSAVSLWGSWIDKMYISLFEDGFVILHDFSRNRFTNSLPLFSFGNGFLPSNTKPSYRLILNNNQLNGSLPGTLFTACGDLKSFEVDLSSNNISGGFPQDLLFDCLELTGFDAANNQISGSIPSTIGDSHMLQYLDLRENMLTGSLPDSFWKLKDAKWILLGRNNLTGEIPTLPGHLNSLTILDFSVNALSGMIPSSLANATNLTELFLDHNQLSGNIPLSFSTLASLTKLDVSFNHLSGSIPHLQHVSDCDGFKGNNFLLPCPDPNSSSPAELPISVNVPKQPRHKTNLKVLVIVLVATTSLIIVILLTMTVVLAFRRKKLGNLAKLKSKVLVTFTEVPAKLNYDIVVRATGNFSVRNLIGTGGFGATYKAELVPGFLVAVKRLAIGRFQGIQQFDAEIRTLGRIRHKNLVTLIGYYMGETEMFLIYNYLSGGNLESFIHERTGENVQWAVIHKIALDIAQSLAYLHYSCVPRIVHRDIKPSNILLDEDLNAYLSDFGLARLLEVSETHATTDVAGTFGYVAPEYATTCRVSDKADVYSFGIVLLELMSGKKSLDPSFSGYGNGFNIVAWGNLLMDEDRSPDFFSPQLWEEGPKDNLLAMLRLASDCTSESLSIRPSMNQVLEKLKQLKAPGT